MLVLNLDFNPTPANLSLSEGIVGRQRLPQLAVDALRLEIPFYTFRF